MNELKKETWQELKNMVEKASAAYIAAVAEDVAYFAEKEGLSAHARSAVSRFPKKS